MKHIAKSIPKKGSLTNGDSYNFFEDSTVTIAVVADGVGGNACDWKASEQACQDLVLFYQNEYRSLGIKEGIAHSLKKTYDKIYQTKGKCEGMLTTLIAIIIDKVTNEYFYFGIGDSLILKFENDTIEELTPECAFKIHPDLLPSKVRDGGELTKNTSFALMTDGISTNRKRYREELALVLNSENWERKFDQIMQLNQLTQFDDMTLMLLKR
ncbi:MAG: protein phosphatase 2C domain-containing protein [Lewinella sp.]|jgi:serine/threonine protein phosphatase PrpC|uniref:protein phosphatase 2C domain-containing protein n=1 Tax=Lewinella sp. TaxID=2004506 RepID=UPI003D6B13B3